QYFALGSFDRNLHLIHVTTGKAEWTRAHQSYIWSVVFSPDGRQILTGDHDGSARLRDVGTGGEISRSMERGPVRGAAIIGSRPEYLTVSGAKEQNEPLWVNRHPHGREEVIAALCERASRSFTQQEWQFYIGDGQAY